MQICSESENKPLKILLIGKNGQVGWELQRSLACLGQIVALGRAEMDLTNPEVIKDNIRRIKPNLIVNAAAYTAVEKAETERDTAMLVNGVAPGIMAEEAKRLGAGFIHYSTDYVFDGANNKPYTEKDKPNPINVYGKTKLCGEEAIQGVGGKYIILRTSWVYGLRGHNFLTTILRLGCEKEEINVVDDQIGAPTWSRIIAEATASIITFIYTSASSDKELLERYSGIYNISAGGETNWYGFAKMIIDTFPKEKYVLKRIVAVSSDVYPSKVERPKWSIFSNCKIRDSFGIYVDSWDSLLLLLR
jgi:dTDP-4-dehydrorhamnose reductase